jgi:glycosyltransferase involved in cell wall biosynthesis
LKTVSNISPPIKIAFVSIPDARDVKAYSGIPYHIASALRAQGFDVELVSPLAFKATFFVRARDWVVRKVFGKSFLRNRCASSVDQYARQVEGAIKEIAPNAVFSIDTLPFGGSRLGHLPPVLIWGEASFHSCQGLFPWLSNLNSSSKHNADIVERRALQRCSRVIFPSMWAAEDAISHYGLDRAKVSVVPYAANLTDGDSLPEISELIERRLDGPIRLLFMGADWGRKDGNKAVAVVRELNRRGCPSELHVVGCRWIDPSSLPFEDYIINHGFIDKSTEAGRRKFVEIFAGSTFFLMLSKGETFGIVYCEAAAYGVPSIGSDVGGVSEAIEDGGTGRVFAPGATVAEIADYLQAAARDRAEYSRMALAARDRYCRRFSWRVVGAQLRELIRAEVS